MACHWPGRAQISGQIRHAFSLFAGPHYFELTSLADTDAGVCPKRAPNAPNTSERIGSLHTTTPVQASQSYALQAAQRGGVPNRSSKRARGTCGSLNTEP